MHTFSAPLLFNRIDNELTDSDRTSGSPSFRANLTRFAIKTVNVLPRGTIRSKELTDYLWPKILGYSHSGERNKAGSTFTRAKRTPHCPSDTILSRLAAISSGKRSLSASGINYVLSTKDDWTRQLITHFYLRECSTIEGRCCEPYCQGHVSQFGGQFLQRLESPQELGVFRLAMAQRCLRPHTPRSENRKHLGP